MRKALTDASVAGLALAARGKRYEVADTKVAGLVVRVSHTNRSFMFYAKLPGGRNYVRRAIGRGSVGILDEKLIRQGRIVADVYVFQTIAIDVANGQSLQTFRAYVQQTVGPVIGTVNQQIAITGVATKDRFRTVGKQSL